MAEKYKDLFTGRWRTIGAIDPDERQMQISLIERLKWTCKRDEIVYYHTPNGGLRQNKEGALLKAMGVLPGVSDLTFIMPGPQVLFLELKSRYGGVTEEQALFARRVTANGCNAAVANSIDDAVAVLKQYGILP